jgi:hypothetical protein
MNKKALAGVVHVDPEIMGGVRLFLLAPASPCKT